MNLHDEQNGPLDELGPGDPLDTESCLFVLSLLLDGRPVSADLEQRARQFAEQDEGCRAALADLQAIHSVLADEPALTAPTGFTERVLAAQRARSASAGGTILTLARRLSMAAAVVLALTLGWQMVHPQTLIADPDMDTQPHAIDAFRPDAFGPIDLERGLQLLLPDPQPTSTSDAVDASDPKRDPAGEDQR